MSLYDHPLLFLAVLWAPVVLAPFAYWLWRESRRDPWDRTRQFKRARGALFRRGGE